MLGLCRECLAFSLFFTDNLLLNISVSSLFHHKHTFHSKSQRALIPRMTAFFSPSIFDVSFLRFLVYAPTHSQHNLLFMPNSLCAKEISEGPYNLFAIDFFGP